MKTTGNTILITGGATGIGLSMAAAFLQAGNRVIVCGRRETKLHEAKRQLPALETEVCDVADPEDRQMLYEWTTSRFPDLNVLINNAGVQNPIDFLNEPAAISYDDEIAINFDAPVRLAALFIPHFIRRPEAAIINVSSGLAFAPLAIMPVYCATKAALHSFSMSLRHQLKDTCIRVVEVVPPMVDTELDRGARENRGQLQRGIHPDEVGRAVIEGIADDRAEILVGMAASLRVEGEKMFGLMNR